MTYDYELYNRVMGMPVNSKLVLTFRSLACIVGIYLALGGKPPALGQYSPTGSMRSTVTPTTLSVITNEDSQQDLALTKMSEKQNNQDSWNQNTGNQILAMQVQLNAMQRQSDSTDAYIKGGFGMLTVLSGLAIFFQLKKKNQG